jgi:iron complex outermembrane receptor protein
MPYIPRHRLLPLAVIAALAATAASAQQAAPPKQDEEKLQTITVTATKRSEPLQSVPISISVLSGDQLEQANLNTLETVTSQTPSVTFRANASNKDTSLFIRGVGTISTSPGVEPTVSTVVDGVVFARPGQATLDLMDVERLEVLRGPQGTLFGRNASAGVINIVSKSIAKEREMFADLGLYQGREARFRTGISGEFSPGMRASASLLIGKYDGNINNVFLGEKVGGYDRAGGRLKFELNPNRNTRVTLIGDYSKADDTGSRGPFVRATGALATAILPQVPSAENRDVSTNVKERVDDKNWGLSAQVDYDIGRYTLTSITAYREWENIQFQDIDGAGVPYNQVAGLSDRGQLKSKQTSQELRIASPKGGFFDYVVGLFYFRNKTDEVYRRDVARCATTAPTLPNGLTPCATPLLDNGVADYGTLGKNLALFGEGTFNFTSNLRGILGLRRTQDDLSYYHRRVSTASVVVPGVQLSRPYTTGSTSVDGTSGRVGVQFDINKDMMLYATYSRGYKGPAYNAFFNMTATADVALSPERSKGYEVGLKSQLLDNRLRLNLAAFDTKYSGYQANYPDLVAGTVVTRFINAGDVSTRGIELDAQMRVTRQLTLSAAFAHTDAQVDRFNCPAGATCPALEGNPLPSAPKRKGVVRGNHKSDLGSGLTLDIGADYTWQSAVQYDLSISPNTIQPAYGIFNASVALANSNRGWRVALLGKNLGDKSYASFLLPGGNTQRSVPRDDRRYFGVNVRYDF